MSAGVQRPDWSIMAAFNRDPNDATTPPVWVDLTTRAKKASGLTRGRQYELDIPLAADPSLTLRDIEEYLNPANPSSPYYGRIEPYREILWQGVYPNAGTGNLINAGTWRGNNVDAFDPSFESYASGSLPNWLTPINTTPTVGTATPFEGTKRVGYAYAAGTTVRGISWPVACIPGRQYTSSAYVRQDTASTQTITVGDQTTLADDFGNRTSASTWGTPRDVGAAYANAGGTAGEHTVSGGSGLHSVSSTSTVYYDTTGSLLDGAVYATVTCPVVAAGAPIDLGVVARFTDTSNHYRAYARFETDQTITLVIVRRQAGANVTVVSVATSLTYNAGDELRLRFDFGPDGTLKLSAWPIGQAPSDIWSTGTVTNTDLTAAGAVGAMSQRETGNTNGTQSLAFDDLAAAGAVAGSNTTTTGAYVRLSVTFTATQPQHTISVRTTGTAVAGTALVDALQHEQGASASAFTTSGAVIYPVMRNYAERWPRKYGSAGFEGYAEVPCVDALALLNRIKINPEYAQAVLSTAPDYYWRLNDGTDTFRFADVSGNHQPPLTRFVSKYGAGTDIEPGTTISVPGVPGAAGVTITAVNSGSAGSRPGTALGVGRSISSVDSVVLPPVLSSWGMTFSAWVDLTANPTGDAQTICSIGTFAAIPAINPLWLRAGSTAVDLLFFPGVAPATQLVATGSAFTGSGPHHVVGIVSQDATNTTLTIFRDGVKTTTTVSTATAGALAKQANTLLVGCDNFGDTGFFLNGAVTEAACWNRALSDNEATALYAAGAPAFAGELSGTRITRHFALGPYVGAARISAGSTTMQPPSWTGRIDLNVDSLNTTVAEQGTFWPAPDGAAVFEGRQDRWLRLTSRWTFGEDVASGEIPYLGDVEFDKDPTFVFPDVQVTRANGVTAVGGTPQAVAQALRRYFPLSYAATVDVQTDQQAQDMADWVFNSHRAALQRVSALVLDPAANPALWPVVLGVEIGHRVTVRRRAKAANGGAGLTMTGDFFVESIGHDGIDFDKSTWRTVLMLSPIGAGNAPAGPTMQPWILENTTYGVLDATTVLGF